MMSIINDWLPARNGAEDGRDITALSEWAVSLAPLLERAFSHS
jgi:hypothetical protein